MLTSRDIGHRVVVRRRAGERDGRPVFTDVLGELMRWDDRADVRTATGEVVSMLVSDVVAGKRVPPRRQRSPISAPDLERIASAGWPGLECKDHAGWQLRAGGGWTGRANSALPPADLTPDELDVSLPTVETFYRERGLPVLVQVPLPAQGWLREDLLARDYTDAWGGIVEVADSAVVLDSVNENTSLPPVEFSDSPSPEWLAGYHYRGGPLPETAVRVLLSGQGLSFASVVENGSVVAIARSAVGDRWLGVTAVEVDPQHRRRGLAKHLLRALLVRGLDQGAASAYLQVEDTNTAARTLYEKAGFVVHHTYRYLRLLLSPRSAAEPHPCRPHEPGQ